MLTISLRVPTRPTFSHRSAATSSESSCATTPGALRRSMRRCVVGLWGPRVPCSFCHNLPRLFPRNLCIISRNLRQVAAEDGGGYLSDEWVHFVLVAAPTGAKVYIDGRRIEASDFGFDPRYTLVDGSSLEPWRRDDLATNKANPQERPANPMRCVIFVILICICTESAGPFRDPSVFSHGGLPAGMNGLMSGAVPFHVTFHCLSLACPWHFRDISATFHCLSLIFHCIFTCLIRPSIGVTCL